ncbi:MAG: hypothetical protein Ta2E_10090 [Mycoplasmoidaceae bacterium]|nr:MAG: hypothetical protein Ta2E_10090 [Mycoplasmoidaceae bacterium]
MHVIYCLIRIIFIWSFIKLAVCIWEIAEFRFFLILIMNFWDLRFFSPIISIKNYMEYDKLSQKLLISITKFFYVLINDA